MNVFYIFFIYKSMLIGEFFIKKLKIIRKVKENYDVESIRLVITAKVVMMTNSSGNKEFH